MKVIFTFSETPDLAALNRSDFLTSQFKFPDEALKLPDCRERVMEIASLVSKLTWACLHVTCPELGLKNYPVKRIAVVSNLGLFVAAWSPMVLRFDQVTPLGTRHHPPPVKLKIIANVRVDAIPLNARSNPNLVLRPKDTPTSSEQKELAEAVKLLGEQCAYLLNTNPDPAIRWKYTCLFTRVHDTAAYKRSKRQDRERERQQKAAEKAASKQASDAAPSRPSPKTGAGRRVGAVPGIFKGVQFRSQLEIRFATQLEARHITWIYESERLGDGNYLVDFYLPDLKCWVEVKGKAEPRDDFLLREVAGYLARERQERLYIYFQSRASAVSQGGFKELNHAEFWIQLNQGGNNTVADTPEKP